MIAFDIFSIFDPFSCQGELSLFCVGKLSEKIVFLCFFMSEIGEEVFCVFIGHLVLGKKLSSFFEGVAGVRAHYILKFNL